ncbi:MAG TPA: hypothetical protein PKZ24_09885, partial [Nitrospirales bacterium]|nr:hypothetical protein [Nitrospirales bacterium]
LSNGTGGLDINDISLYTFVKHGCKTMSCLHHARVIVAWKSFLTSHEGRRLQPVWFRTFLTLRALPES